MIPEKPVVLLIMRAASPTLESLYVRSPLNNGHRKSRAQIASKAIYTFSS
jgi:hypothetical protein